MKPAFVPLCMTPAEHEAWLAASAYMRSQGWRSPVRPCADCPASFALEARRERKCNGKTHQGENTLERVKELIPLGLSSGQMSLRLGVDSEYIRRLRRKYGI